MNSAGVKLWGSRIGVVVIRDPTADRYAEFQYDPDFVAAGGVQPSPLRMPVREAPYRFRDLAYETWAGLPGMLADSLPDRFGNALIESWLQGQGRSIESFSSVERLCYIGKRGVGALEFEPALPLDGRDHTLEIAELTELAARALHDREGLIASFKREDRERVMLDILKVGTSAGGARPKALIAFNPESRRVRSGQVDGLPGYDYWLLKFDGVRDSSREDSFGDPQGYGSIEFAYHLMATDAGVRMSECRLLEENGRRHFMTKRFDRVEKKKVHVQTLGALAHLDFNLAGVHSYEQAFDVAHRLGLPHEQVEQLFRRMVFNVVARNCDDHVKNISFLMDREGVWSLAPAYDVTYAYNPEGRWTSSHQMSINGKRRGIEADDIESAAKVARLPRGRGKRILAEVSECVAGWAGYAEEAGVAEGARERIQAGLRSSA